MSDRHGYGLRGVDRRLLRSRPPDEALAWVAAETGGTVVAARALQGGTSSAVHRLTVENRAGRRHALVLRRYVREDWLAEEPDLAEREAAVLALLETGPLPTPQLVAVDPTGAAAGLPAVLMTLLPGRVVWSPADLAPFLRRLAALLPPVHATAVPAGSPVHDYRPYELGRPLAPPPWTRHRRAWERAIELYEGPQPSTERVFLHRDFHPGNVLWTRGRVSGLVDWAVASVGAAESDVGHCRANLRWALGPDVADRFLALWQDLTGRDGYHPYWDVVVEVVPEADYGEPDPGLDEWIARAVAETAS